MNEERKQVLEILADGKITAEEAARLIDVLAGEAAVAYEEEIEESTRAI